MTYASVSAHTPIEVISTQLGSKSSSDVLDDSVLRVKNEVVI